MFTTRNNKSWSVAERYFCSSDTNNLENENMHILLVDMMCNWILSSMCDGWDREMVSLYFVIQRNITIYHVDTGPAALQLTLPSLPARTSPLAALNIQHQIKLVNKLDVLYWVTFVHWGVEKVFCTDFRFLCKLVCVFSCR